MSTWLDMWWRPQRHRSSIVPLVEIRRGLRGGKWCTWLEHIAEHSAEYVQAPRFRPVFLHPRLDASNP